MDTANSANVEERIEPGGLLAGGMIAAEAYSREAALKPESRKAGYGIYTHSQRLLIARVIEGNEFVIRRSKPRSKEDDLQIEVTGEVKGNVLKVESIRIVQ
jgi:hypothetical protein